MKIVLTTGYYNPTVSADHLITRRVAFQRFAEELQRLGHEILIVYPFKVDVQRTRNGVRYQFVRDILGRDLLIRVFPIISAFQPDVIHFSGLTLDRNLWLMTRWARWCRIPVVVQYHGGEPAAGGVRRRVQQANVRRAARLLFTAKEQSVGWGADEKVTEFTEMSSDFEPPPKMAGQLDRLAPVLLCVSRLNAVKDPLTVLRGLQLIVRDRPNVHLHWLFSEATMQNEVETFIAENKLEDHVTLHGHVAHGEMIRWYQAVDFFIQASIREVASIGVLEAMACGVTPVLSDIPAFRRLTGGGEFGRLFPVGNAQALAAGVLAGKIANVHKHFRTHHSYPALARQLVEIYGSALK